MLFNSIVFGTFCATLLDYWLGRAGVRDNARLIISIVTGVIVGFCTYTGRVAYF